MKKELLCLVAVACVGSATAFAGNGIDVNGAHYNLNLIGKTDCGPLPVSSGKRIQVLLVGGDAAGNLNGHPVATMSKKNKIFLTPGDTFDVPDPTACDGALFQLPAPVVNGTSCYSVWARALGNPAGLGTITTCAADSAGVVVCSTAYV